MPFYLQIALILVGLVVTIWVAGFLGELHAWRHGLPSITDTESPLPAPTSPRVLSRWEHICWALLFVLIVLPLTVFAVIIVTPPVLAVSLIAKLSDRSVA